MEKIATALKDVLGRVFGVEDVEPEVVVAPEGTGADWATNAAMKLAGRLRKAPMAIAEEIKDALANLQEFEVVAVAPGFVNFISRDEYLKAEIEHFGVNFEENISHDEYFGKTVVTEFSDPNPFKVLHVGHLYTSIVGDAISRLIEDAGGKVHRVNFGGDVGLHVAKTLWALDTDDFTIEEIAKAYVRGTRAYEEDEKAKAEIVAINKKIYDIALNDKHEGELAERYWRGREMSYRYFDEFYARIGVKFERYYPESMVAGLGLEKVKEELAKGVYEESAGAVIFPGEKYGLHTRVFINKEGLPTYEAKDVGLIFAKWRDYHFDESVVITGNDIIDYMKVVLKSISLYAPELVERTTHITHGNVRLPGNEKMSSRKGNFLKAVDVLEMVRGELSKKYGTADERVVMAAVKYAFLKYKIGGNIVFDVEESVSMTGNSGPYLLYSVVRARKVLERLLPGSDGFLLDSFADRVAFSSSKDSDSRQPGNGLQKSWQKPCRTGDDLKDGSDEPGNSSRENWQELAQRNLSKKLLQYRQVLGEATREKAPHLLGNYLFELAQEFSRFYEKVKVVGSEQEGERAQLVKIFAQVMEHGLGLMGIEIPEEM